MSALEKQQKKANAAITNAFRLGYEQARREAEAAAHRAIMAEITVLRIIFGGSRSASRVGNAVRNALTGAKP